MSEFDISECAEARIWTHEPGARGLGMCACGTAGTDMGSSATRSGSDAAVVHERFRHTFHVLPVIVYEPDAVAFAAGVMLGPGLHRAIERERFVEHECIDGRLYREVAQTRAVV